ncbi:schwannomin-interacting protein 1-like isoform X2 [Ambystoma mexicanum]|uniref:schwannomin-interacting protein 1-like isoform X2 n=1 Tax=Ambystoma mexicanum TaxID=8296 RepID=UPI0037E8708A
MAMDRIDSPSLDWKALESHLAQLQQREGKEAETSRQHCSGHSTGSWSQDLSDELAEDKEMTRRITALTSGIHTNRSMQLCFINDSSSDLESDGEDALSPTPVEPVVFPSYELPVFSLSSIISPSRTSMESTCVPSLARWKADVNQDEWKPGGDQEKMRCFQDSEPMKCWLGAEDLKTMSIDQLQRLSQGISLDIQRLNLELLQELTQRDDLQMSRDTLLCHLQERARRDDLQMSCASMLLDMQEARR